VPIALRRRAVVFAMRRPARSRRASAASARTATGRRPTNLTAAQPVAIWTSYSSVEATASP
jgi:hypothetical protein